MTPRLSICPLRASGLPSVDFRTRSRASWEASLLIYAVLLTCAAMRQNLAGFSSVSRAGWEANLLVYTMLPTCAAMRQRLGNSQVDIVVGSCIVEQASAFRSLTKRGLLEAAPVAADLPAIGSGHSFRSVIAL